MSRSPARRAANEATFRTANERIEASARNLDVTALPVPFTQIVRLTLAEYEQVRSDARRFFVSPGHQSDPDRVVAEAPGFTTVEKTGDEGTLVAELDPRA